MVISHVVSSTSFLELAARSAPHKQLVRRSLSMLLLPSLLFLFALKMPSDDPFINASDTGEIPSFNGDAKAKATDFANYFCSYAQLYHQKQMLVDHNRMAAYHSAIMGNADVFKDKVRLISCWRASPLK